MTMDLKEKLIFCIQILSPHTPFLTWSHSVFDNYLMLSIPKVLWNNGFRNCSVGSRKYCLKLHFKNIWFGVEVMHTSITIIWFFHIFYNTGILHYTSQICTISVCLLKIKFLEINFVWIAFNIPTNCENI